MRFSILSVASLAIAVGALTVTEPQKGDVIAPGASVDVKWTSVDTDATSFDIYLVNNAVYPSVNKKLATNIQTSKNSETVSVGNIPDGHGYQINLVSDDPKNTGILAQTGQFNVTGSAQSSSTDSTSTSTASVTSTSHSSTSSATATTGTTSGNSTIPTVSLTSHSTSSTGSNATVTTSHFTTTSTGVSTTAVITGEVTKTAGSSGLKTSASASASASTTSAPSNAGAAVLAHPVAALGVVGGALAFML